MRFSVIIRFVLGIMLGAAFIWFAIGEVEGSRVGASIRDADWMWLAGAVACLVIHYPVKALRWRVLLETRGRVPLGIVFRTMMAGFLVNDLVPLRVGDLSRPYLLTVNCPGVPFSFSLATVVAAKVTDLLGLSVLFIMSAALFELPGWLETTFIVTGLGLSVGISAGIVVLRSGVLSGWTGLPSFIGRRLNPSRARKVEAALDGFRRGITAMGDGRVLAKLFVLTAVSLAMMMLSVDCILRAVHIPAGPFDGMVVLAMMHVAFALPAPPTFAGNLHFFVSRAVVVSGMADLATGLSVAVFVHLIEILTLLSIGLVCIPGFRWRPVDRSAASDGEKGGGGD